MLGLTPAQFGYSFMLLALAGILGGLTGRRLFQTYTTRDILERGLAILFIGAVLLSGSVVTLPLIQASNGWLIGAIILAMTIMMFGISWVTISSLSSALEDYQHVLGTASALFGFSYYSFISLVTFVMAELHDDTIFPMPFFFLSITLLGVIGYRVLIKPRMNTEPA